MTTAACFEPAAAIIHASSCGLRVSTDTGSLAGKLSSMASSKVSSATGLSTFFSAPGFGGLSRVGKGGLPVSDRFTSVMVGLLVGNGRLSAEPPLRLVSGSGHQTARY